MINFDDLIKYENENTNLDCKEGCKDNNPRTF